MNEIITFPEEKLDLMIAFLERGLEQETDKQLKKHLKSELKELKDYARRIKEGN